ncbi:Thiosulfate sulfurtransferase GlpE [Granulosicoccus antarcticus IMCC3135]|uniref:Thiosulfate sulfurtransferase GlpE n=1 Tax=Granulosicoccus antarcticus IMCC3135 TaxID=1192854 RepID=A0A2Z2NMG4_9GAMM|nr:Thiosulfate sulfurtransferase GlpE [Granulosicoccus antarcticus IMCC3135]
MHLDDTQDIQQRMKQALSDIGVQGSIMLASEGINVSMAGTEEQMIAARNWFNEDSRFAGLWLKQSLSRLVPYRRLRVRVRTEIIAFDGQDSEALQAQRPQAPSISPDTLSQWLDEARDITLLDTRNDYEIVSGTFPASVHMDIKHFRNFKAAVTKALEAGTLDKEKPMVTYCTGGIRCEKAAPWLLENGFREVYQIEGGLLNYLETCGSRHWQGDCFVFDERVELTPELVPTGAGLCYHCQLAVPAGTQCRCQLGTH